MGWPENTPDFQRLYHSFILETGWDILFFWLARRYCSESIQLLEQHAVQRGTLPRDDLRCALCEMSKSPAVDTIGTIQGLKLELLQAKLLDGNLDEHEITKTKLGPYFPKGIPQCGTHVLRFALCAYSGGGT
ncbi:hypothetical protein A0H81_06905 [Grifola frondosa]|uniref:valine--tRNA ligase n=1 Tax=Grifola frondosa TaxID=5627 RepID=A0A1C7M7D7_GRIFR|nr:hypothetical protein A0H81_06905 [Grifola frondosa]